MALYGSALDLPDAEPELGYNPVGEWWERNKHLPIEEQRKQDPQIRANSQRYQRVCKSVAANLGGDQPYLMIFDPFHPEATPLAASVSDDLSGIYCDLQNGLVRLQNSAVTSSVVWQWQFDFQSDWGRYAISVMTALYALASSK